MCILIFVHLLVLHIGPFSVSSNQRIPIRNTLGCSAVVFCACEIIYLFSVVFCVVTAVNTFYFSLVINETHNKLRPVFVKQ